MPQARWLDSYRINEYITNNSITTETIGDDIINAIVLVDRMITKLVLTNTTECEGVETTRKINIYPDIKNDAITIQQIYGGLHKFFREWESYFHRFYGENSDYNRYNQQGDEGAFVDCDKATVNGTIMTISITLSGVYNLK